MMSFTGRQEIVELPVLSQEGSEVSCQSWDLPGSQEVGNFNFFVVKL